MQKLAIVASILMLVAVAANADIIQVSEDVRLNLTTGTVTTTGNNLQINANVSAYLYFDLSDVDYTITGATISVYELTSLVHTWDVWTASFAATQESLAAAPSVQPQPVTLLGQITLEGAPGWRTGTLDASLVNAMKANNTGIVIKWNSGGSNAQMAAYERLGADNATGQFGDVAAYLTVVPEPTTLSVLGLGALALLRRRR